MAIPRRKKGYRKIVVNGIEFSWRMRNVLRINPVQNQHNKLIVDFGYFKQWLVIDHPGEAPDDYNTKSVTPFFVQRCIRMALENNWDVTQTTGSLRFFYEHKQLTFL